MKLFFFLFPAIFRSLGISGVLFSGFAQGFRADLWELKGNVELFIATFLASTYGHYVTALASESQC